MTTLRASVLPLLVVLMATSPLKKCDGKVPVAALESCATIKEMLYTDPKTGEADTFVFSDAEIDALSEENQTKIDSVKRYYRKRCVKVNPASK